MLKRATWHAESQFHTTQRPFEDAVEQTLQLPASPAPLQSMTRQKEAAATASKDLSILSLNSLRPQHPQPRLADSSGPFVAILVSQGPARQPSGAQIRKLFESLRVVSE